MWYFTVLLVSASLCLTSAALFGCPAQHPCLCDHGQVIECSAKSLSDVPYFNQTTNLYTILKLSNNQITYLGSNKFASLNNVTILELDHNQISRIDSLAFGGIATGLTRLNLAHNKLQTLPGALAFLDKLSDLDVSWNPLDQYQPHHKADGLTDGVMRALGDSMNKFAFGDSSYITWPKPLTHLNQLKELRVSGSNYSYWPPDCFHGFEHTLKKLTIEYAALAAIPIGITTLTAIEELHLDHLHVMGRYGGFPFNDGSLTQAPFSMIANTLHTLSLNYDGLKEFPEVIQDLTRLQSLSLDGNDLQFISDEAISLMKHSNVTKLSLKDCNLKRVPGAISDLQNLLTLDLSQNKIRSIESTDLQHLGRLRNLSLSQNPLKYFSNNSLCGMNNLRELHLYNTSLTELSQSFQHLSHLNKLDLRESRIDCTCDIAWLLVWKQTCGTLVDIEGECETISMGIKEYITTRLQTCPDYEYKTINVKCDSSCN